MARGKKKKREELEAEEAVVCRGGSFVGYVQEDHRNPVYSVSFWPGSAGEPWHHLCAAGANRASVYGVAADGEPRDGEERVELRQVYEDGDEDERFYTSCWTYRPGAEGAQPLLCVAGSRGIAKIIDVEAGALDMALIGHGNAINDACFSPADPCLLLTASKDESIRLWNVRTNVTIAIFAGDRGHRDEVLAVDAHLTGAAFCSAGMDNTVKVWQLDSEAIVEAARLSHEEPRRPDFRPFPTVNEQFPKYSSAQVHSNYVDCARWVGSLIASKSTLNQVVLWSPDPRRAARLPGAEPASEEAPPANSDCALVLTEFELPEADIWFLRFGVDARQRLIAAGDKAGKIRVWGADGGAEPLAELAHKRAKKAVRQVCFCPNAKLVVGCCDDATFFIYKLDDSELSPRIGARRGPRARSVEKEEAASDDEAKEDASEASSESEPAPARRKPGRRK